MKTGVHADALENDYIKYYESFGLRLVPIPNVSQDIDAYFGEMQIEGILLTGGNSINPVLYGSDFTNEDFSDDRDRTEKRLVEIGVEKKLPILANCRGVQFLNVFFGGALIQDIKEKIGVNHVNIRHVVTLVEQSASAFFGKQKLTVNSYHKQGIDKSVLSLELQPFAESEDGSIEGLYHKKYPIAGVMWHPERSGSDPDVDRKLVQAFVSRELFWSF